MIRGHITKILLSSDRRIVSQQNVVLDDYFIKNQQPITVMSVVKIIEISSEGKSIEDAIESGIKEASKSIRNIKSAWTDGIQALCDSKGKVTKYRVNLKLSFLVE
jgi:dodecin